MHGTNIMIVLAVVAVTSLTFCQGSPVSQQGSSNTAFKATSTNGVSGNAVKDVEFLGANEKLLDLFSKYPSYNYPNYNRPIYPGYPNYYPYQGNLNPGFGTGGYPGINPYPGYPGSTYTPGVNYIGSGGYGGYGGIGYPGYGGYSGFY
ncbi:uncharacterized protein LOC134827009 isoform X2 [Culicoides brevitarsis]|uniref:uncharacterized protein LOC134827009 isoform X2 n=1 Tax=Culicoides brevitarsis TaxID=469753 RepID=UPI00307B1C33